MINARCKWTHVTLQEEDFQETILNEDSSHIANIQDILHCATLMAEASELNTRHAEEV